jgi:phosphoglycerate dehydrogenase-like enzyme
MEKRALCAVDTTINFSIEERLRLDKYFDIVIVDLTKPIENYVIESDLMLIHSKVPNEVLIKFKKCRYIGIRAHNIDYIDSNFSIKLGIIVDGIPQVGGNAVAEHTFSLIFALTKQILLSNNNVRDGRWRENLTPNYELYGRKLGIIGYGTIGQIVANIGRSLGMTILISAKSSMEEDDRIPLEELLRQSDIVTLHASTKAGNEQLITKDRIALMKDGAIIINTARGKLLDYIALETALLNGKLSGAGLDVFPEEPIRNESICHLSNVICTPHHAFYTDRTISIMNDHLINNAIQYMKSINLSD